ncbi:MAG: glycosyltransferase [Anaerolineales bacterium]|nr:glycosyltransferase [Anaerolineales bacterium]
MLMYVGNLQTYQGIDMLLESFALALKNFKQTDLVIIGGVEDDIHKYKQMSKELGIEKNVYFLGPKPVEHLAVYLSQADILVSPRTKGRNTPMKVYSYLHSGKPLLATDMPTHTQILDNKVAMLAAPSPQAYAEKMVELLADQNLRTTLGKAGEQLIEDQYSYNAFRKKLNQLFDWLKVEIDDHGPTSGPVSYTSTTSTP